MIYLKLFISYLKIGFFGFGGGYAMVPLIEEEIVEKQKWVSKEEFVDIIVLSQSFPGALAVNCSTMVGYKIYGIVGAIVTLLGAILPSFIIMLVVAMYLMKFRNNVYVNAAFSTCPSLPFPHCVHKSAFYVCISIPAL